MAEKPKGIDWSAVWKWFTTARIAGLVLLGFGLLATIGAVEELRANAGAELISIALTVLVIDALNEHRATQQEKKRLILQMGSPDNTFAIEAVRQLRARGWLRDGSLQGAHLFGANLQEAILLNANLERADLETANLQGATLSGANLQRALLDGANLQGASLFHANLQEARLWEANLQRAWLIGANLSGATLIFANLQEARLWGGAFPGDAKFDENTILPDGTKWTPDTDDEALRRFTDPEHPEFWQPPIYQGYYDAG